MCVVLEEKGAYVMLSTLYGRGGVPNALVRARGAIECHMTGICIGHRMFHRPCMHKYAWHRADPYVHR